MKVDLRNHCGHGKPVSEPCLACEKMDKINNRLGRKEMNKIREYVDGLTDAQSRSILTDWEEFEQTGAIGDGALRYHAQRCLGADQAVSITLLMREVAFECYRRYAVRYFEVESAALDMPV